MVVVLEMSILEYRVHEFVRAYVEGERNEPDLKRGRRTR